MKSLMPCCLEGLMVGGIAIIQAGYISSRSCGTKAKVVRCIGADSPIPISDRRFYKGKVLSAGDKIASIRRQRDGGRSLGRSHDIRGNDLSTLHGQCL